MNVIFTIASLVPEAGGPSRSTAGLCSALTDWVDKIHLVTVDMGKKFSPPLIPSHRAVQTSIVSCTLTIGLYPLLVPEFYRQLDCMVREGYINLIHDNGLWLPTNVVTTKVANKWNIPLVVNTRGMLEPWAMKYKQLKKRIMWHLYQRCNLEQAKVLHATSVGEANNLRSLGLKPPIAIIPNGIELPSEPHFENKNNDKRAQKRTLLFLSRIHPKKGLINLVKALKLISPAGWQVIIAGPDEVGHQAEVEAAIRATGLQDMVTFWGPADDTAKWDLFRQADLFVLPTFSENFGIVVAEALACNVPVITTKGAPWQELITHQCGWWIDVGVEPLAHALAEAMNLSDEERFQMGQNGYRLVRQKYTWPALAEQMAGVYRWVLGQGPKPECVI